MGIQTDVLPGRCRSWDHALLGRLQGNHDQIIVKDSWQEMADLSVS